MPQRSARFKTELLRSDGSHEWIYIRVPLKIVESLEFRGNTRRVVCTINKAESFQCAVMPNGKGDFYITVNKEHRTRLGITEGDTVAIELEKDTSKYPADAGRISRSSQPGRGRRPAVSRADAGQAAYTSAPDKFR